MNPLNTQRLFLECPYAVSQYGDDYTFKTDYAIVLMISRHSATACSYAGLLELNRASCFLSRRQ